MLLETLCRNKISTGKCQQMTPVGGGKELFLGVDLFGQYHDTTARTVIYLTYKVKGEKHTGKGEKQKRG